jgi:hypothetical protein
MLAMVVRQGDLLHYGDLKNIWLTLITAFDLSNPFLAFSKAHTT